jgi:cytoskeletal protein CcmA (bactofilin family)
MTLVVIAVALAIPFALRSPQTASAAEFRSGDSPSVKSNETIHDDLFLFGANAAVRGTVTGDTVVSAGDFTLAGKIGGSLSMAVGTATIGGTVGRSVRIAGGDITITGKIGGDVVVFGGSLTIRPGASVGGDVVITSGDTDILGPVKGTVRGSADTLTIDAPIGGDVRVDADHVRLNAKTRISGDLRYRSRNNAVIDDRARITGVTEHKQPSLFPWDNINFWFLSAIFRLLCALIAGAVVVLLAPRSAAAVADALRQTPLQTLITGLVLIIVLPVLLTLAVITLIGLPVALIGFAFYSSALYLSQVFVGLAMGRVALPRSWGEAGRGYNLLAMTIGVIILAGLRLLPIPYIGWVIAILTANAGLGAIVVGLSRRGRPQLVA